MSDRKAKVITLRVLAFAVAAFYFGLFAYFLAGVSL